MPIVTGFQNLANAGVFGTERSPGSAEIFNSAGGGLLSNVLDIGRFGLDVFQTVRGGGSNAMPAPAITASSTVPTPDNSISRFAGNFAPGAGGAVQAMGRLPLPGVGAVGGALLAAGRTGVAFVLRKIKANTGLRITTRKIVAAIRQFGPAAVATWAGVSMAELMIVWDRGSRRVKRRFTKRDRSRGRSYIRHLKRQADELKSLGCGPKTRTTRRSKC